MAADAFDPYHKWLQIPKKDQPPHYYRLLGLETFETDLDVIAGAADQRMAHVRTFQMGQHAALSQQILNEVTIARVCLLNAEKKSAYDANLKQSIARASLPVAQLIPNAARPTNPASRQAVPLPVQESLFEPIQLETGVSRRKKTAKRGLPVGQLVAALSIAAVLAIGVVVYLVNKPAPSKTAAKRGETSTASKTNSSSKNVKHDAAETPSATKTDIAAPTTPAWEDESEPQKPVGDEPSSADSEPESEMASAAEIPQAAPKKKKAATPPEDAAPPKPKRQTAPPVQPAPPPVADGPQLLSVPETENAEKELRVAFAKEIDNAKTPAGHRELADKLAELAKNSPVESVDWYVMMNRARQEAALAGDADLAILLLDEIGQSYAIILLKEKESTLAAILKTKGIAAQDIASSNTSLTNQAMELATQALASDDYSTATKALETATAAAKKTKDLALVKVVAIRSKEVARASKSYSLVATALARLKTTPDDAPANLIVGKYHCFQKDDWAAGLPNLAKGNDEKLQELAAAELGDQNKPGDLANQWWDYAEHQDEKLRDRIRAHAVDWYQKSVNGLVGLEKSRAEKRIAQLGASNIAEATLAPRVVAKLDILGDGRQSRSLKLLLNGHVNSANSKDLWWVVILPDRKEFHLRSAEGEFTGNLHGLSIVGPNSIPFGKLTLEPQKPTNTATLRAVFLRELGPQEFVSYGADGEHRSLFFCGSMNSVADRQAKAGIFMHAPAHAKFTVPKDFTRLSGGVGFADEIKWARTRSPLIFTIKGDSQTLWTSPQVLSRGQVEKFDLDIKGMETITLTFNAQGTTDGAWGVWIDPVLKK